MQLEHRIIHLDLKGAPWKVPYLEKVLLRAKAWGATGVLFEWEDTFPYTDELVTLGSITGCGGDGMYTMDEVQHMMQFCKENGLEVVQLVQTIGHLEFVLKHPAFTHLRELPESATSLCPSKPQSLALVCSMLDQVLDAQPNANYLHIGADEVWHTGVCPDCKKRMEGSVHGVASLYLEHIQKLALFLKMKRPNLTILMWDDMLRSMSLDALEFYKLGELVQPVLWDYNVSQHFHIRPRLMEIYRVLFPKVWAASAFKGASGDTKAIAPVSRYVSNHVAWMNEVQMYPDIKFAGIILTGWSRYDHFKTLCELLPVSLPSLASCLRTVTKVDDRPMDWLPAPEWPGAALARGARRAAALALRSHHFVIEQTNEDLDLHPTNSNDSLKNTDNTTELLKELYAVKDEVTNLLSEITGKRSTEEWVQFNIMPSIKMLTEIENRSLNISLPTTEDSNQL
ncbi:hexosaminidase D-like isoform X2 [Plodia interpunctella]|uniref:hexosaminidase D-like isoform X2 n=1 Tax=Plodia interpunctella TaxID=58824 RepID=UPI0023680689|nr:hexosaminidase D-like isoform X2 [Plodia interpunctella]